MRLRTVGQTVTGYYFLNWLVSASDCTAFKDSLSLAVFITLEDLRLKHEISFPIFFVFECVTYPFYSISNSHLSWRYMKDEGTTLFFSYSPRFIIFLGEE